MMVGGKYLISKKEGERLNSNKVSFEIPSCLSNLALIRSFVRAYLEHLKVSQKDLIHLLSAVDELATNAVEHGYDYAKGIIKISMNIDKNNIIVSVEDFGKGYDDTSESKSDGGIGLVITKKLVDEFKLQKKHNGTIIEIKKKIKEAV